MGGTAMTRRGVLQALSVAPMAALAACSGGSNHAEQGASTVPTSQPSAGSAPSPAEPTAGPATSPKPGGTYVPPSVGEWEPAGAADTRRWSSGRVTQLVNLAETSKSTSFMMLSGGRILAEAYFGGLDVSSVQDIASVQKSFTSTLLGMARADGLVDFDASVQQYLGKGWTRADADKEQAITVRHLMTMSSGLSDRLVLPDRPGEVFNYNTAAYQRLRHVLEAVSGLDINTLSRQWLFDPIGISPEASWAERPKTPRNVDPMGNVAWGLSLTARDLARFGLLALRGGAWGDQRVTPEGWFNEAWTPSSAKPEYGLLWWLAGRGNLGGPRSPDDWVAALGANDQKVYVIPSLDLVVVRQGDRVADDSEHVSTFDKTLIEAILAAYTG